jgi:GNAT superfamily N-acetyltransferase
MIRDGTFEDVPRAAAMRQRARPDMIVTPEAMRHFLEQCPERARLAMFACEEDGEIVGWATASHDWVQSDPRRGHLAIAVDPPRRGWGIGRSLAEAADAHLAAIGITTTRAGSLDEPGPRALAARFGFAEVAGSSVSAVDPRTVEPLPVPAGVALVPFAEIEDPRAVYELEMAVSRDIPNETFESVSFDEWRSGFWRSPSTDDDASLAAFVDGELAAVTMIGIDRPSGRAQNSLCGVLRTYRGRGLALLLKSHSLRHAAELGATIVLTDNDETNAPMLAVNTRLGYRPFARRLEWERVLA